MTITQLPCSLWLDVGSMLWSQPLNVMLSCHCNEGWREVPGLSTCLMPDDQPLTAAILALLIEVPDLGSELHPPNMFVTFALLHDGKLRRHRPHYDVIVMNLMKMKLISIACTNSTPSNGANYNCIRQRCLRPQAIAWSNGDLRLLASIIFAMHGTHDKHPIALPFMVGCGVRIMKSMSKCDAFLSS